MGQIGIENKSVRCDYRATTETEVAKYGLRYTVEDGTLTRVHASVEMKADGTRGNLSYDRGEYTVEMFPYGDGLKVDAAVADFKTVVAAIGESLTA